MKYEDQVKILEEVTANGKQYRSDGTDIIGEVEVIYHSKKNGKAIFTRTIGKNELLVTGAVFFTEKANNMRSSFRTQCLDDELGVRTTEWQDEMDDIETTHSRWYANLKHEKICGITIGNGGCGDTYNTVYKVNRSAKKVPGMIPFRVGEVQVDNTVKGIGTDNIDAALRSRYFMVKTDGTYAYFYGKKFDSDPEIFVQYEDGTTVPLNADTLVTDKFVRVFTRYKVTIDQSDVREYFKLTQKSTLKSLVNSIGLVSGWPVDDEWGYPDFANIRQVTTFNMENHELKDSESTIEIIYRLFIQ